MFKEEGGMTPEQEKIFGTKTKMIAVCMTFVLVFGFLSIRGAIIYLGYFGTRVEAVGVITRESGSMFALRCPPRVYRRNFVIRVVSYEVNGQSYQIPIQIRTAQDIEVRRNAMNGINTEITVLYNPQNPANGRFALTTGDQLWWAVCIIAPGFVSVGLLIALIKILKKE
jgi:hypothetical protein